MPPPPAAHSPRACSSLSPEETTNYAAHISQLASKARGVVRTLDPTNDLTFLRVRSKKHEIMVSPDKDYNLIVIQNASGEDERRAGEAR